MNTEIITAATKPLKETGFGVISFYQNVVDSIQTLWHTARLNLCDFIPNVQAIVTRKPDLNIFGVKYTSLENKEDIWLSEYFTKNAIHHLGSSIKDFGKIDIKTNTTGKYFSIEDNLLPNMIYSFRYFPGALRNDRKSPCNRTFSHII